MTILLHNRDDCCRRFLSLVQNSYLHAVVHDDRGEEARLVADLSREHGSGAVLDLLAGLVVLWPAGRDRWAHVDRLAPDSVDLLATLIPLSSHEADGGLTAYERRVVTASRVRPVLRAALAVDASAPDAGAVVRLHLDRLDPVGVDVALSLVAAAYRCASARGHDSARTRYASGHRVLDRLE